MKFGSDSNDSTENLNIFQFHFFLFYSLGLLTRKLPHLPLELCLGSFQVCLPSVQASCLLSKGVVDRVVAIDVEALARWRVVVDIVRVVLQAIP
jgi:hypothetical protein